MQHHLSHLSPFIPKAVYTNMMKSGQCRMIFGTKMGTVQIPDLSKMEKSDWAIPPNLDTTAGGF